MIEIKCFRDAFRDQLHELSGQPNITTFHQHESKFHMTCDLNTICGASYRTYAAYQEHISSPFRSITVERKKMQALALFLLMISNEN